MDFQQLVSTHPDLAPSILNVFSTSLKQEQAKVKDLESKLEASNAEKIALYELRIRQLQERNQQLEAKVDAQGEVEQEAAETIISETRSLHQTIAKLEGEADDLRSDLRASREDLESCRFCYAELEARATKQQGEYERRLSSTMQSYTSLRDASTAEIKNLAGNCDDLRGQLATQSAEKARVAEEHDAAMKKSKERLSQLEEATLRRLEDQPFKWKDKIDECNAEIERLRAAASASESERRSWLEAGARKEEDWACKDEEQRLEIARYKAQLEQSLELARQREDKNTAAMDALKETLTKEHDEKLRQELEQQQQKYHAKLHQYKNHSAKLKKELEGSKTRSSPGTTTSTPPPTPPLQFSRGKSERDLYKNAMNCGFPIPPTRPQLSTVHGISQLPGPLDVFQNPLPNPKRKSVHFPQCYIWTSDVLVHLLVYAPAEEYRRAGSSSDLDVGRLCGQECDLFVSGNQNFIYYAGTYMVHSLRFAHPPGSAVPLDVNPEAILRAIPANPDGTRPMIPVEQLKTECFGLQCTGFDQDLYRALKKRFEEMEHLKKRKASEGGGEPQAKSQKIG